MSSYKEQTARDTKEFKKKEQQSQHKKVLHSIKDIPIINKNKTSLWNQHTYDVGTWTKDKIEMESLLNDISWSSIVSRTPKQNSYPCTINLHQNSSLSSLSHNNYRKRRKKKDKVNEFIEKMGKRQTNNTSKKLLLHNTSTINSTPTKHQSASVSTSDKNPLTIQKSQSPNQQTDTINNPESKRLKIFTEIYTPTKHKTNLMGRQSASINNLKDTEPSIPHPIHNTTHFPYKSKVKQRDETSNNNKKANLPNKPKQQKMSGFGFNCAQKVHDSQKDTPMEIPSKLPYTAPKNPNEMIISVTN